MREQIISEIGDKLDSLGIVVAEVNYENQEGNKALCIGLDRKEILSVDEVVEATKIINPIIDKMNEFKDIDILDIYAIAKGDEK